MDWNTLSLFILTEGLLSLSPGPAVLLVVGYSLRYGFRIGFGATMGVLSVNAIYYSLSALGVGALILASATLFTIVKWVGAAYLAYLGITMLRPLVRQLREGRRSRTGEAPAVDQRAALAAVSGSTGRGTTSSGAADGGTAMRQGPAFLRGFVLQASNPKNLAFFVAILPQFIQPEGNVALQLFVMGVISVLLELPILLFYGFASAKSARIMRQRVITWIEGVAGGLLVVMGAALALYRRST